MKNLLKRVALFLSFVVTFSLLQTVTASAFSWNNNGGGGPQASKYYSGPSSQITLPSEPGLVIGDGRVFAGWSTVAGTNGSGSIVGVGVDNISFIGDFYRPGQTLTNQNITLYATWTALKDIYFLAGTGSGTVPNSMTVPGGTSITLPSPSGLSKTGSCFDGWKHTYNSASTATYNQVFLPGETFNNIAHYVYFTAQWRLGDCPISYDGNGNTGGTVPSSTTAAYGTTYTLESNSGNLVKTGYSLLGWSTTPTGSVVSTKLMLGTSNIFYAVWRSNSTYNITFRCTSPRESSRCSGGQTTIYWTQGDTATALPETTTITRVGYSFVGWTTSSVAPYILSTSFGSSYNVQFSGVWTRDPQSVTFNKNSDTATGTMAIETRSATTALPLNAFTWDANHTFLNWTTAADGSGTQVRDGSTYTYVSSITLYARWGNTISYSSAGADTGTASRSSDSWSSGAISLPTAGTMVKAGYSFGGWSDGSTTYTTTYTPTTGITLNPVWTPYTYTVSFNKNAVLASGAVPSNQTWVESTTALTLSGNTGSMVRTGYSFGGWATSASAPQTAITTFASTSNTLTQTLYAIWTPVSYSVTYALDGGTSTLPTEANKNINNTFTIAAAATRDTYIFGGWSDGTSIYAAGSTYTVGSASITLTAQWIPTYTVHYVMNGSSTTPTADTTTASGYVIALASEPSRTGYTFAGWLDNLTPQNLRAAGSNFIVVQDSTLQASWTPVAYTVTYALASGTSTLPTQVSQNINNTFTIASTPTRAGYLFTGWNDGTNTYGAGASYVVGSSPITLTAQWSAISYTVTYDLGGGVGTLPTKSDVNIGNTFIVSTVTDPTWPSYTFVGWTDGVSSYAKTDTYTVGASNIVLSAVWRPNGYTQITYANGGGSGTLPTQVGLLEGSQFPLASGSSLTKNSFAFVGWSDGTDTYTAGTDYVVGPDTSPVTLTAQWGTGYSVTYASGTGTGTVPIDATSRASGTLFALASGSSLSKSGFTFAGWNDGTATYLGGAYYTFGSSNITLTAVWTAVAAISGGSNSVDVKEKEKPKETVLVITRETKSTESIIVDAGIKAIKDSKKFDSYFTKPADPTTPVIKQINDTNIVVISAETSVNTQGFNTTSDKPVTVPITLTNPIITDEAAKAISSKITVENNGSNLKITAVGGFTGSVIVPVIATVNGVQTTVLNRVVVSPAPPIAKGFSPVDIGKSTVDWKASTSQVVSYEVAVNGKVACTTTTTTCPLPSLIGPKTKVTVNAIGNDQTKSAAQVVPYTAVKPIPALKLNFGNGSTALTTLQKSEIRSIAKVINTQGFTRLVVNGFTDATGSPAVNAALSKARATSVVNFMKTLLPKVSIKAGANGAAKPIANNDTDDGRAQNRRTEIATW